MLHSVMVVLNNYFCHWPTTSAISPKNEGVLKVWKFRFKMGRPEIQRKTFQLFSDLTGSLKDCQRRFRPLYNFLRFFFLPISRYQTDFPCCLSWVFQIQSCLSACCLQWEPLDPTYHSTCTYSSETNSLKRQVLGNQVVGKANGEL